MLLSLYNLFDPIILVQSCKVLKLYRERLVALFILSDLVFLTECRATDFVAIIRNSIAVLL